MSEQRKKTIPGIPARLSKSANESDRVLHEIEQRLTPRERAEKALELGRSLSGLERDDRR